MLEKDNKQHSLVPYVRGHLAKHLGIHAKPDDDRNQALLRFKHFSYQGKFKVGEGYFHYVATSIITTFSTSYLEKEERKCSQLCPKYQINNKSAYFFDQQTNPRNGSFTAPLRAAGLTGSKALSTRSSLFLNTNDKHLLIKIVQTGTEKSAVDVK